MKGTAVTKYLRDLYEGDTERAETFRYGLLAFDAAVVAYIVATSFLPALLVFTVIDALLGVVILGDLLARIAISRRKGREILSPMALADVAAVISFLAPMFGLGLGFLRVLRPLRLIHAYQLVNRLRQDFPWFRRNQDLAFTIAHLSIFLFGMTGVVYATQYRSNPEIANYVDALYFTVTSLTTTGYGDILLTGTGGRLLSIVIMIAGMTLFLRLVRALIQPNKVTHECPSCGLQRHDPDAVHCKHCGTLLHIPTEGA